MGRSCLTCRLPIALRLSVEEMHANSVPLRAISADLADKGHHVSRDAIHRHVTRCVAPPDDHDLSDDPAGLLVAVAVSDVLGGRWPTLTSVLARRLIQDGAVAAARIVVSKDPESMRPAIEAANGTPARLELEARALIAACRAVLSGHPEAASALAADVAARGADDLAAAIREVSQPMTEGVVDD